MNQMTRRQRIEALLREEPNDTFLRYSLALELEKEGDHERGIAMLRELMQANEPYVPAFFMCGQCLVRLNRVAEARLALRDGIEAARRKGESHAAAEMSEFLASLGFHGE